MSTGHTPEHRLKMAAQAYTQAKAAVDEWEGERRGELFEAALLAWRAATTQLTRAARAFGHATPDLMVIEEKEAEEA